MAKSIRTWDVGKEVSCLQIEIFEGNYDKSKSKRKVLLFKEGYR